MNERQPSPRRVYPLDNQHLTEEQIAVAFAMTSRSPDPFDEIALRVSEEKAAGFHERWVLDYGHASVAEHAIVHLAVENISRLACDSLESNRLASYTEKSSRYQVIDKDSFHTPAELDQNPGLRKLYQDTCQHLFDTYHQLLGQTIAHLHDTNPQGEKESSAAYQLRLRRTATDACRGVLPAATLTNVGVTANARTLEHAVSKLMSSTLAETRELGSEIRDQARLITPTLLKYADEKEYLRERTIDYPYQTSHSQPAGPPPKARIVESDDSPEKKLAAAILYHSSRTDYPEARARAETARIRGLTQIIRQALDGMGPHDALPREFESISYTFEFCMDYGALREFRRHRIQTPISQPLTVRHGPHVPTPIRQADLTSRFLDATRTAEETFLALDSTYPQLAQYVVTHAHLQLVLARMNLREFHHLCQLRTSERAHESIRGPVTEALRLAKRLQPVIFKTLYETRNP